jgi:hypothetical protein
MFIMDSSIHAIQSHSFPVTLFVVVSSPLEQDLYTKLEL